MARYQYNKTNHTYKKTRFHPKKPIRSFRDLEVYQRARRSATRIAQKISPIIEDKNYVLKNEMITCALSLPNIIAEAHSDRFDSGLKGMVRLNDAMADCNKMIVYLEQVRDIYSEEIDKGLIAELIREYFHNRRKIFHLYKAWEGFLEKDQTDTKVEINAKNKKEKYYSKKQARYKKSFLQKPQL